MAGVKVWNHYLQAVLTAVAFYYNDGELCAVYDESALKRFAQILNNRIKNHRQNVILIEGGTGSGKSTVGVTLARFMNPKWDLAENYVYYAKDFKKLLRSRSTDLIVLFDEAAVSLNSLNYAKKDDKKMSGAFDTMRSRRWTSILIAPDKKEINSRIREIHSDYMIKCPAESPIPGYSSTGFCKIYKHKLRDFGEPYFQLIATCIFPDMPPGLKETYDQIKSQHQDEYLDGWLGEYD